MQNGKHQIFQKYWQIQFSEWCFCLRPVQCETRVSTRVKCFWYIWFVFRLCLFLSGKANAVSPHACFTTATSLYSKKKPWPATSKQCRWTPGQRMLRFPSLNKVHPTNLVPSFEIVLFWYICYLRNERGEFERSSRTTFAVNLCNTERLPGLVPLIWIYYLLINYWVIIIRFHIASNH